MLAPNINFAPKMSNRKLRHDLDKANTKIEELAKELEALRDELRSRPTTIIREIESAPRPILPISPGWPAPGTTPWSPQPHDYPIVTCALRTGMTVADSTGQCVRRL